MQTLESARESLNRHQLTGLEDEFYLQLALENWTSNEEHHEISLKPLAESLMGNHGDSWLRDFVHLRQPAAASRGLLAAIRANHSGDATNALKLGKQAEIDYQRASNLAGVLRSRFEQVYALRRLSKPSECVRLASSLAPQSIRHHYSWIAIQTTIEQASCEGMSGHPDVSWSLAADARLRAEKAKYNILRLRTLGLVGNLDALEGRSDASWKNNGEALDFFWRGVYPDDRGFQLYYNLQVDAERNQAVYLALVLQRETLKMIAGRSRFDFESMAHFRLAGAAQSAGDLRTAQQELRLYQELLAKLPASSAKDLYAAYCEVGLARLSLQTGSKDEASAHLNRAAPVSTSTQNLLLRLEYLKVAAEVARAGHQAGEELIHLRAIQALANSGFGSLRSPVDRWRWRRVTEQAYRRLLEMEISSTHSPVHALGIWELYRKLASAPELPGKEPTALDALEGIVQTRLASFHQTSLVTFAVLSESVVAWTSDDRGVREFKLPVRPSDLRREAQRFYALCSDPNSPIEKVNASGARLYEWLIAPLEQGLGKERELAFEPDGFLSLVPWAALLQPDGTYLGRSRAIRIHSGLFADVTLYPKGPIGKVVMAIPDSLQLNGQDFPRLTHAGEEAEELSSLHPGATVLRGDTVTVSGILDSLQEADIFEFAGHAITRDHGGELVVHARDGAGILSASSLSGVHLRKTRLVVLSACSTAAEHDADRDPGGLVRAFLNAGAGSVVATRWDVDSKSTARFMREFHSSLSAIASTTAALRFSRQKLCLKIETAHPYYWAGIEIFSAH